MNSVHLLISDLFLPPEFASEVCAGLHLPALEKILSRGKCSTNQIVAFEDVLSGLFVCPRDRTIAQFSAAYDGLEEGCWLRADPVHLRLQREQVVLLPEVRLRAAEAQALCVSLNEHFAGEGLTFFAPDSQRWYVRVDQAPDMVTVPMSLAAGRNIHGNLPTGRDSGRWHQLFNEIQMLLFAHPLNEARESRGELPVNSVWFWGNGSLPIAPGNAYDAVSSDEVLVQMLAQAAGSPFLEWQADWQAAAGAQLLVWTGLHSALQRGDLHAWREALQYFENHYAQPLWDALCSGRINSLRLDAPGGDRIRQFSLTRSSRWVFWHQARPLADYSATQRI